MNGVVWVLEANTSGSGIEILDRCKGLGLEPIFISRMPSLYPDLRDVDCRRLVCETNEVRSVLAALDEWKRSGGKMPKGLTTTSDFYVGTAATVARCVGLEGPAPDAVAAARNKEKTRLVLTAAGLPQPKWQCVGSRRGLLAAIDEVGLPCVVKPSDGTGSLGVKLCSRRDEAVLHAERLLRVRRNARDQPATHKVLIEECVTGPEFSVETLSWNGCARVIGITEKRLSPLPYFVERAHIFPANVSGSARRALADVAVHALDAIGFRTGPAHVEVRLVEAATPVVIEINPRLAGGRIPQLISEATGIDLLREQVKICCRISPDVEPRRREAAGILFFLTRRSGLFRGMGGLETVRDVPGVLDVSVGTRAGESVRATRSAFDRIGWAIVRGPSYAEVRAGIDLLESRVHVLLQESCA